MNLSVNLNILIKRDWAKTNDSFLQCEYIFPLIIFWFSIQEIAERQYYYTDMLIFYVFRTNVR